MQTLEPSACPFPLEPFLLNHLNDLFKAHPEATSITVNYRDPDYSSETGGFHPVEIRVEQGCIHYITDFCFYGMGDMAELGKEIDFDFEQQVFEHMGQVFSLAAGRELFELWQCNFISYIQMDVFDITLAAEP